MRLDLLQSFGFVTRVRSRKIRQTCNPIGLEGSDVVRFTVGRSFKNDEKHAR